MLIDTHVHYNLEPLFSKEVWKKVPPEGLGLPVSEQVQKYGVMKTKLDGWYFPEQSWQKHWEEAQSNGVTKSIVVGTDYHSNKVGVVVCKDQQGLFCSFGNHPSNYLEKYDVSEDHSYEELEKWVKYETEETSYDLEHAKKVVAIGETGLDYFRLPSEEKRKKIIELQKISFISQIQLSKKYNLPLILHVRDAETPEEPTQGNAYWDALAILQKNDVKKFTLHCVSGPLSYVKAAVEMGGYMGFDGNITYPSAQKIRDIFNVVPAEKRLLETDAPFLAPQGFRGKLCEPWMIVKTAEYIEESLHVEKEIFAQNAERLFSFS